MPVQRFKDVSEMPALPRRRGAALVRAIREVMARAALLGRSTYPPGVYRYRSLGDAQEARRSIESQRLRDRRNTD